jgi:hypothetical protein
MKRMLSHAHMARIGAAMIATLVQMAAISALFAFQSAGIA